MDETDSQQYNSNSTWGLPKMVDALRSFADWNISEHLRLWKSSNRRGSKCQAQLPHIGHGFCLDQPYFGDLLGTQFSQI